MPKITRTVRCNQCGKVYDNIGADKRGVRCECGIVFWLDGQGD